MHVKSDDEVIILAGKDRKRTGEVLEVDPDGGRVKVERCNMVVKHEQPDPVTGDDGERVHRENWMDASNVALFVEQEEGDGEFRRQPVRVGYKYVGAGGEMFDSKHEARESFGETNVPEVIEKVRIARQTGDVLDPLPDYT